MFGLKKDKHINRVTALIMAAGSGSRMHTDINKQFIYVCDRPLVAHTLLAFEGAACIDRIVVVTKEEELLYIKDIGDEYGITKLSSIVVGGKTRQESVVFGLHEIADADYIAIHDGARPCITSEQISQTVEQAVVHGAAALGCRVVDTLKRVEDGRIIGTVDRSNLWHVQTPQVFKADLIKDAHTLANERGMQVTDDTALLEELGMPVYMVEGNSTNIKVTTYEDIAIAEGILGEGINL